MNGDTLLKKFNSRERIAFSQIYLLFYDDLYYFASNLYRNCETDASDVVQDSFLKLWEAKKQQFSGLINIKAYLFVIIRNSFKNYLAHKKQIEKHQQNLLTDEDFFVTQIVETEIFSYFRDAINILPQECGRVLIEYLNGLDVKEIALKLNRSEFTVYKQRKNAIEILKQKLPKDKMFIISLFL